jgi:hypothetical protein
MGRNKKLGHQAPKGSIYNRFNHISLRGDFGYCASHNFVYNPEEEERKLYNGEPCYYTDVRYVSGGNFYKNCYLKYSRWKDFSLKAAIRKTLGCRNIPVGTIVNFDKSWYIPSKRNLDLSYEFKIRNENRLEINYEINSPRYSANFNTCEFSKNLTDALRANGFIVAVDSRNQNFLLSLVSTAAAYIGKHIETTGEEGETAIAYGHGKKIGFSSRRNSLFGYHDGCENILFDHFGEFDKWSRARWISKDTDIDEIVNILIKEKPKN